MSYRDLRGYLQKIDDDLIRVEEPLDPQFEVAALLREAQDTGCAVLFENVKGYDRAKIAGNLFGSRKLAAVALETTEKDLAKTYIERKVQGLPPVDFKGAPPVQQVVIGEDIDLLKELPILTHHERDAAPYITSGLVVAKDPDGTKGALGIHRMMVHGPNRLGMLAATPPMTHFIANAEREKRPLEVAVILGADPATILASVVKVGPGGPEKFETAGALRGLPLELCRCKSVDLKVPAFAEVILEGRILPGIRESEGPFGENSGNYFTNVSPVIEIGLLTRREEILYPGLCPWTREVDNLLSLAAGTELLSQLQALFHGVVDLEMEPGTCGFKAICSVSGMKSTEVRRLIYHALSIDRRLKVLTVVDDDVNPRDAREVSWALATRFNPERDMVMMTGLEGYVIDTSSAGSAEGSKVGFDATSGGGSAFEKIKSP
ncbi:MAG: UbiD family decarboxylase [Deltaproteobacteria bacterium]|nr:MAG: UbiD family decarboxylase [Deltaproteobacteria bacterium]